MYIPPPTAVAKISGAIAYFISNFISGNFSKRFDMKGRTSLGDERFVTFATVSIRPVMFDVDCSARVFVRPVMFDVDRSARVAFM